MSIKSELTKTASYLRNARNAIIGRGGEISLTAGLKDLSDAIYNIPSDAALVYQTEESVAYRKSVPTDVLNFAKVSKVGGMSYKSKNLVNIGTVMFSVYKKFDVFLPAAKRYYISTIITSDDTDATDNQIGLTFDDGTNYYIRLDRGKRSKTSTPIFDGKNIVRFTIFAGRNYPTSEGDTATYEDFMVCEENTDVYEPYFAGLRHTKVSEIVSESANLIPFPYMGTQGVGYTATINGLTYTVNSDGSIHVIGTSESAPTFRLWENCEVSLNSPLSICGYIEYGASSEKVDFMCRKTTIEGKTTSFLSDRGILGTSNTLTAQVSDGEIFNYVGIYIASGRTVDATIYPMLNYGTTAAPYKPYRADNPIDTLAIPEAVQALDGYGVGVNADHYNHIEFVDGKVLYHKVCEKIVFDGTENWLASDTVTEGVWRCYLEHGLGLWYKDTMTASPAICNKYESVSASGTYRKVRGLSVTRNDLYIYDEKYNTSDISLWKAHLAQLYASGDPLTAVVVLAEPIVTDVTEYFTDMPFIEVEGGGTLTAVNEYENAVHSTINYITETAGA